MSHADPPSQRPRARERSRSSFLKRRSFFGGRPESMSFDPIAAAPQQTFKASSPAAQAPPPVQGHILYHDLVPAQRAEETPVQHKRRSIFSVFKLGSKKQDYSQPVFEYQQPRRDPSPQYAEQLARTQHIRGPSLPVGVNDVQRTYSGEDDCVSTRPFSFISAISRTDAESDYHSQKKASISPPFNFQHVTHTHKKHLPALDTVAEKDLTKEFWQASAYQTPQTQLQGIRAQDLGSSEDMGLRDMVASRVLPSGRSQSRPPGERSGSRPPQANERSQSRPPAPMERSQSRPPAPMERSQSRPPVGSERSQSRPPVMESLDRIRSKSREEITALPGLTPGKKASVVKRRDDTDALLGVAQEKPVSRSEGLKRSESVRPKNDSSTSLLGFDFGLRPTRSHSTSSKRTEKSMGEDGSAAMLGFGFSYSAAKRSAETSRSKEKTSQDGGRPSESDHRSALSSLVGGKERSHSGSSSTAPKRDDVNALLGISPKDAKRQSKQVEKQAKKQEANALLGIRPKRDRSQSKSRQAPAPLRPRRSDEALKSIRYEATPSASSPSLSTPTSYAPSPTAASSIAPQRPLRAGQDEQVLNEMGLAQLLHRPNSNESRHSPITPVTPVQYAPRYSEEQRRVSIDAESVYPPDTYEADHIPDDPYTQQARYRNGYPVPAMPSIPSHYMTSREARGPLQTVVEHAEYVSPLQSPTGSAMSPVSQNSAHSARLINPRSPELTGPNMPDDETWMDEIDFLYKQNAEATNDFDWDNVSMTPHRLSARAPGERLSLNMPSLNVPNTELVKKLSEGSLRQSYHLPSSRTSKDLQYIHRDFHNPRKAPSYEARLNDAVAGARASPEVRVIDVDERVDSRQQQHDVAALQMHGYESLAAGYLSDPESASSQHRKSNSYGSWESRRSVTTQREQQTRSSNTSVSSVPELLHARRGPKPPITTVNHIPQQQPMSPYQEPPAQHPMHEYAAFSQNPYAGGQDSRPQSSHRIPNDQPPPIPFHSHPSQQQKQNTPPQEYSTAAGYLSNRRPETIDENAILRAAGDAVKHGRAESRSQNRNLHYQPGWI